MPCLLSFPPPCSGIRPLINAPPTPQCLDAHLGLGSRTGKRKGTEGRGQGCSSLSPPPAFFPGQMQPLSTSCTASDFRLQPCGGHGLLLSLGPARSTSSSCSFNFTHLSYLQSGLAWNSACIRGWSWIPSPSASTSQALGLQVCATTPSSRCHSFI